ncbi:hypothetical protein LTR85_006151 [Meristemomyces frigidus]|nr:hypothetical protein LTR85_006151 [Meristemomyces frigidus]
MTLKYLAGWRPYRVIALDADTGQPLDPNIGRKTYVTYYDIKKDKNGSKSLVAHRSSVGSGHGGNNGKGGKEDAKKNGNGNGKGGDGGDNNKGEEAEWTADEDAKLKALKADNTPWKQIAEEMSRPQYQLKARFKEIKDTDGGDEKKDDDGGKKGGDGGGKKNKNKNKGGGGGGDEGEGKKGGGEGKKNKQKGDSKQNQTAEEKKAAGMKIAAEKKAAAAKEKEKKHAAEKAPSKAGSTRSTPRNGGEAKFTMNEWMTLQEDSLFSFGELQCLSELILRDQNQTWLRIAAAFYDKTGRRVHPEDIREKFEEMAALG